MDTEDETKMVNDSLPKWAHWNGDGMPPPSWWALDPKTGLRTKVYRSYSDYCDD